jgi:hypothetical protein
MQHAIVLPIASEVRQLVSTASRAVAARAQDQVKTVRTTNQEANSGKCVCTECGSRAPAACEKGKLVFRPFGSEVIGSTHGESIEDSNSDPEAAPHGIDHRHQRVSRFEAFDAGDELGETCFRMSVTCSVAWIALRIVERTSEYRNEGKEDRWALAIAPPHRDMTCSNPCRAREAS